MKTLERTILECDLRAKHCRKPRSKCRRMPQSVVAAAQVDAHSEVLSLAEESTANFASEVRALQAASIHNQSAAAQLAALLMDARFADEKWRQRALRQLAANTNEWREQPEDYHVTAS